MVAACVVGHPNIVIVESVKFLKEGRTALVSERFQEDQIFPVLQSGILDVLDGLEEGSDLSVCLALLLCLRATWMFGDL